MNTPDGNAKQNDKESSESSDTGGKQQEKKDLPQKKNTLASDKSNLRNSESEQSSSTKESTEQADRQKFELPQTTSSYHGQLNNQQDQSIQTIQPIQAYSQQSSSQNSNQPAQTNPQNLSQPQKSNQEYPSQPGQPQQQYSFQPRPPYPTSSPQYRQYNPQYYSQPAQPYHSYPSYPSQPRQYASNQYPPQGGRTPQQYSSQSGQYTAPPMQYQHVYYNPNQMNPQRTFVIQVPPQPQSAQDTPVARPGVRPRGSEPTMEGWKGFQDKKVRRAFIRKVYIILTFQLLFTMGIIALFVFEPHVKEFIHKNIYLYYVCMAVFIAVYIGLSCFQNLRRSFPSNLIALIVFTVSLSCMLGIISSFHKTEAVLMAVGICAAICFVVTVFSIFTKIDFTACGAVLCILLLVLILFGLIAIFIPSRIMILIYAGTGATVFTLFLAYDIQMLMGGKTVELSPEEYIFAAVQIYLDVAYIFLYILTIITFCNE